MAKRSKKKKELPASVSGLKSSLAGLNSPVFWQLTSWDFLRFALIAAAIFWIYAPTLHGDWLWDDDTYISENPLLRSLAGLGQIWFSPGSWYDYYPIQGTVLWFLWQLCGTGTFGYHLTTLGLHLINALLVWRLFGQLGLRLAWVGGLLFAIHPIQVESVAWMAELKNTLSLLPFLVAMGAWVNYSESRKRWDYARALFFFLIAMLCKISMAPFPIIILLYAWWKKSRIGWHDLKDSAPFFLISLLLGMTTVLAGIWYRDLHHLPPDIGPIGGFFSRVCLIGLSLTFYFFKCLWPVHLLPIYPQWPINPPAIWQFWPWPLMAILFTWAWIRRATWGRHVWLGAGFFILNLLPLVGIIAASYMNFTWVMDHFLYLPLIGLIGLAVGGLGALMGRLSPSAHLVAYVGGFIIVALLASQSRSYAVKFIDQKTLWTYTIQQNPQAWPAYNNLGLVMMKEGNPVGAIEQFKIATQKAPGDIEGYLGLGKAFSQTGREAEAVEQFQRALEINPNNATAQNNLGLALLHKGKIAEAIPLYQQALNLDPDNVEAHYNLGIALAALGHFPESIDHFQTYLRHKSDNAEAFYNLGMALAQTGKTTEAVESYERALQLKPNYIEAHNNLGVALQQLGRIGEAQAQYEQALQLNPDYQVARTNLLNLQNARKNTPAKR